MSLRETLDDVDNLGTLVPVLASEIQELVRLATSAPRAGVPLTRTPCPRRNSSSPSSRSMRRARSTVFVLMPMTAARSRAGGSRSPGCASLSAIARRICAAAC